MNKDLFYQKMTPYFQQEMVREVYSSDHVCILSLGEICYVACSYVLLNNEPFGLRVTEDVMKKIVENNRYIYPLTDQMFSNLNKYQGLLYDFSLKNADNIKEWIKDKKDKNISKIDYNLEEEIQEMSKNKSK